jgi:hypothetical protein
LNLSLSKNIFDPTFNNWQISDLAPEKILAGHSEKDFKQYFIVRKNSSTWESGIHLVPRINPTSVGKAFPASSHREYDTLTLEDGSAIHIDNSNDI